MKNESAIDVVSRSIRYLAEGRYLHDFLDFALQVLLVVLITALIYYIINIGNRFVEENKRVTMQRKQVIKLILSVIGVLALLLIINLRGLLLEIFAPFILAVALAYILNPLVKILCSKGIPRLWGVLTIYLSIAILIFLFSITLIPRMTAEVTKLIEILPHYSNEAFEYIYDLYLRYNKNVESLPEEFAGVKNLLRININRFQEITINVISTITEGLLSIFSKVVGLVLIPILAFYFLKDADEFKKGIVLFIPSSWRKGVVAIARDIDSVLGGFIRGQLIVASFVGILTAVSLLVLRVNFAVLVGLIAGSANVIPYFGPVIGIVLGVLFALMDSPMKALWVIIVLTIIQQIETAILSPKIVGQRVGVHPIVVILALIIGGKFFGLVGLLIAVPTAGVIKVLGKHIIKYVVKY